ncbi:MAG: DUF5655 domain-containing protein [Lacisediminihabitans sp.]
MSDPFQNLQEKTGRTMPEWFAVLEETGAEKHADLMRVLKTDYGVSHGFANGIALQFRARGQMLTDGDVIDAQYVGAKAPLRPVYEAIVAAATALGSDVEVSPKKTGVSLRRSKQFALIEVPSAKRIQLGLQLPGVEVPGADVGGRLRAGTTMCSHRVDVTAAGEVDDELVGWLRAAYEGA